MTKKKINILITGSRGFIGKNLVEYLEHEHLDKYSLFYPYHSELELLDTEKVFEFIVKNNIDVIVHCANIGGSRKTGYDACTGDNVSKNLRMFFNLVRCLNKIEKMIFLGTGAEYDLRYYKPHMNENYFDNHIPADDYGFSKYVCSKYIENIENLVNLRLFGVFGKYEDYQYKFISNAIVKNLLGLPIIINQNVYFDYLYVNDLVKFITYFIEYKNEYKFYNAVSGNTIDLATIAKKINIISENPSEIIIKNVGLNTEYSGDNKRLLDEVHDIKYTPFDKALAELYSWYKDNLHKIDKNLIKKDEYFKYCRTKS